MRTINHGESQMLIRYAVLTPAAVAYRDRPEVTRRWLEIRHTLVALGLADHAHMRFLTDQDRRKARAS